ncbi:unnamed protein product [Lactuca virosa]|uniref:Large ribosomal subunit protein bL20c n=1 Tax=Lactuca virosa TaxID=75947 RepID=A0AAU9PC36_9ASTR|nr:unnamed protein product [Lactuca virosa]
MQRKFVSVKPEESELEPMKNSSKRRTASVNIRSNESPKLSPSVDQTVGMWRENNVGPEAKELLEAIERQYPDTFQGLQIRGKSVWLNMLKEFHMVIKRFMETSVDAMLEEDITSLQEDLNMFQGFGFDLSWAFKRLNMVNRLKFGNEPLQKELIALEGSLEPLQVRIRLRWKQLMEAHEMWNKAQFEYDNAAKARDKKVEEMVEEFGAEYDRVLKAHLGFGMLPGPRSNLALNQIIIYQTSLLFSLSLSLILPFSRNHRQSTYLWSESPSESSHTCSVPPFSGSHLLVLTEYRDMNKKEVFKLAKGFRGRAKNCIRIARERVEKALQYSYRDRRNKKRDMRSLWIERINAGTRVHGVNYGNFMHGLIKENIQINRKVLSELSMHEPYSFKALVDVSRTAFSGNRPLSTTTKKEGLAILV